MTTLEAPAQVIAPSGHAAGAPAGPGRTATRSGDDRVRVYVWEIPVRLTHWVNVFAIIILAFTGGYIGDPFLVAPGGSIMRVVRFIHMITAFVFLASGILRFYWLFAGNQYARWRAFLPVASTQRSEMGRQVGWYLFIRRVLPVVIGHNALAALTYTAVFLLFVVQVVTGFALAGMSGTEPWATLFGWVPSVLGGVSGMRLVHHLVMWVILAFMIHHVYSALLMDMWERNGLMSSIFSGNKFLRRRDIDRARDGGPQVKETAE